MSAIINFSINLEAIDKSKAFKGKKGTYYNMTMFVQDETKFNNNVRVSEAQYKEEREASKESKQYPPILGNGAVSYVSDSGVTVAVRDDAPPASSDSSSGEDDLPF